MLSNAGFQYRFSGCFVCNSDAPAPGSAMKQALQLFQSLLEPDVLAYDHREHHDQYQANQQIHAHRRLPSIRHFVIGRFLNCFELTKRLSFCPEACGG
jgi:hypothetical protein